MSSRVEYLNPPGSCPAQGLYSHVGRVSDGPILFVAGQLSVGSDGAVAGKNDFAVQFGQVFKNLASVLGGVGSEFDDVIKFTTYLVDSQYIDQFMELRSALFPKLFKGPLYPPNTLLMIDRLIKPEFLIEVEAVVRGRVV
jgi:enamine deaminase RidA (YjgF/YER057c/UK114 family)